MNISGRTINAEYLIGRRFTFVDGIAPDFTCVSGKDDGATIRAHATDHGAWWIPLDMIGQALAAGLVVESDGVPFVWERGEIVERERPTSFNRPWRACTRPECRHGADWHTGPNDACTQPFCPCHEYVG